MQVNKVVARGLVAAVAASMIGAGLVGVAYADNPAKAVVGAANATAGTTGSTTITVFNADTPNITAVRILPPLNGAGQVVATLNNGAAGAGGTGWDAVRSSDGKGWKFSAKTPTPSQFPTTPATPATSKGLAQSTTAGAAFTLPVTYVTPDVDTMARWRVQTSTNDGASYTDAAANAGSVLVQTIRVLTVSAPTINFVRPNLVTQNQDDRLLTYTVTYRGNGSIPVTTSASNGTGDSSPTQSATLTSTSRTLTYSATPSFPVASATPRALTASATGVIAGVGSASAAASSAPFKVQEPADVTVTACTITVSGNKVFAPTATVTQNGGANVVDSVNLAADGITLDYGTAASSVSAATSTTILRAARATAKGASATAVSFADMKSINPTADQTSAISYTVVGTDANGAPVLSGPLECGSLSIDVTAPVAAATLSTGIKQPTAVGQTRANADGSQVATHGSKITVSGTISNGQATSVTCTLFAYNDLGQPAGSAPDVNCPVTGTTFTAVITAPNFALSATSAKVRLITVDGVGNTTESYSSPIVVDPLVPIFDEMESTTVAPKTIKLVLEELTAGSFSPQEFEVMAGGTRHFVETVTANGNGTGGTVGFSNIITLTLRSELGEDDMPTVTYKPLAAGSTAAFDGADNLMASVDVTKPGSAVVVLDGIVPAIPALATVDGKGPRLAENTYYVNVTRPVFSVTGVSDNHTVEVYVDADLDNVVSVGDRLVCSQRSTGESEVLCTPTGAQALEANADYPVMVVARDAAGNVSAPEDSRVTVDTILDITVTRVGADLVVNFGEIVEGRDFADDWYIADASGATSGPLSVVSGNAGTTRRLVFAAGDPVLTGPVTLSYAPAGAGSARYTDLAGNIVTDRSFTGV